MTLRLSVVIPARNAALHLAPLLAALAPQLLPGDECIVVDDASTDNSARIAEEHGVAILSLLRRGGPSAARNAGAKRATGDVLVFLDADVAPHPGLLSRFRERLEQSPGLSAVFGSYDANPSAPSTVSRFRNLLHCYTHRTGNPDAGTFWAGCGAIRRSDFLGVGGFDAVRFPEPSVEDIELGLRLKRSGGRILLDPSLQVQHRKAWTFASMLRADFFHRAIPWAGLILEGGSMPRDLNLKSSQRVSAAAVALAAAAAVLTPWAPQEAAAAVAVLLALATLLNVHFYRFLATCGGWPFAIRSAPLHWVYYLCALSGFGLAWIFRPAARRIR
jgi:glycosyltransferase involved in cell wall biosynthesis